MQGRRLAGAAGGLVGNADKRQASWVGFGDVNRGVGTQVGGPTESSTIVQTLVKVVGFGVGERGMWTTFARVWIVVELFVGIADFAWARGLVGEGSRLEGA